MKKYYLMAGITIICWSTMAPVTKALLSGMTYMGVLFYGSLIAFVFLLTVNCIQKNMRIFLSYSLKQISEQAVYGLIGIFIYTALYYFSLTELSAQDACIINYLWPIMIVLFSAPILKEKITIKKMTAILISFAGLIVVASKGNLTAIETGSFRGIAACFAAAVCYGLFSVLNKKADYNQSVAMMIYFGMTAVASGTCFFLRDQPTQLSATPLSATPLSATLLSATAMSAAQWLGVIWLGVFVKAIAYFLWALALNGSDTAKISNLAYLTPFLSVIISAVFLREPIYIYSIIGLVFIISGIVWMSINVKTAR